MSFRLAWVQVKDAKLSLLGVPGIRAKAGLIDVEAELARLGTLIEHLYQMPMDIEWTWAEGKFAIVQARPITALPEPEAPTTIRKRQSGLDNRVSN